MSPVRLFLLGSPRLEREGAPVEIHRRQGLALLAYLAVTNVAHARDAIAALLWPEEDAARARADLRRILSALGHDLGPGVVLAGRESVGIDPASGLDVDVTRFRALLASVRAHGEAEPCDDCLAALGDAAALYGGDFMAGATLRNSASFDEWQFFEADSLRRDAAEVLERLARALCGRDPDRAADAARRLLSLDRAHEPAHRLLMEIYAGTGRRAAALRQYAECERVLAEEFGEPPSAETQALLARVRAGDLAHAGARAAGEVGAALVSPGPEPMRPGSVPVPTTPCLGRDLELAAIARHLADPQCRLVTLVGPGGIGKTRLALEAAAAQADGFRDGVVFVPLAGVGSPANVPSALAAAAGVTIGEGAESAAALACAMSGREALFVLDNFDRLLEAAVPLVDLLERAPGLKLIVTSRERLNVRGEWLLEVKGLPLPEPDGAAAEASSVQLFVLAARRASPDFDPDASDLAHVARICRLVAGMPLGIELAAGWARVLSCAEIAAEVEAGLGFLETTMRDVPERHRSMRAVFEGSWLMLSEGERHAFAALSVFRGGLRREAVGPVAGASLPTLSALADKSLLRRSEGGRYELHELLRQFAAEKLGADTEAAERVRDAHCDYYTGFLGRRAPALSRDDAVAVAEIAADIENVRAAWWRAVEHWRAPAIADALDGLFRFFDLQGWFEEGRKALAGAVGALEGSGDGVSLGRALAREGAFCVHLGLYERAWARLERAVPLLEAAGADVERALAINRLGVVMHQLGDQERARELLEESLAISRSVGDEAGVARSFGSLGYVAAEMRNYEEAEALLEESLARNRATGRPKKIATALNDLGYVEYLLGKYDRASALLAESLEARRALGHRKGIAVTLELLGYVAEAVGDGAGAESYFQEALTRALEIGVTPLILDVATGLSKLRIAGGERDLARDVLSLCAAHPAAWDDTRRTAGDLLARLGIERGASPRQPARALQHDLDDAIARLRSSATRPASV